MSPAKHALTRRRAVQLAGGTALLAGGVVGCGEGTSKETSGKSLSSAARLPKLFTVPLPVPRVARPVSSKGGVERYEVEQREEAVEILPGLKTKVWGYDGTFPGPTFAARSNRTTVLAVRNTLTVPTATHLHGGKNPPDMDGYPTDLLVPEGSSADRWKPRASGHGGHGGHSSGGHGMKAPAKDWTFEEEVKEYAYPLRQRAATLWYHDHRMDFSAPQVWRGLAGFFLVHDDEEEKLPLPEGERDVPLMLADRSFEEDGSFSYPSKDPSLTGEPGVKGKYHAGVLGDVLLVNGAPWPVMEVSGTRYRFRLLNASNARRYRLALESDGKRAGPLVQIGSDGGLLERPVEHETLVLSPGERFDVVVDFGRFRAGSEVTLVNTLGEGDMGQVMRFEVGGKKRDDSRIPARLSTPPRIRRSQSVKERTFDFRLTKEDDGRELWTINGEPFDTGASLARPRQDTVELWRFSSDFHHPVHLHQVHFQVVTRNGKKPAAADVGWKDTVDLRPYEVVEALVRFDGYKGRYMVHCHNLEHEDMGMMGNFHVT